MSSVREPRVWMNISTSANWTRPPVGIVRVEREAEAGLAQLYGERFHRCIWKGGRFVSWGDEDNEQKKAPEGANAQGREAIRATKVLPWMFPVLTRREALRALVQGLLSLMPMSLRPFFNRMLYRARWRVVALANKPVIFRWLRYLANRVRQDNLEQLTQNASQYLPTHVDDSEDAPPIFERGDILISLGLDWDGQYYKQFYCLRRDFGVRVVTCCYDLIPVFFPQYCVGEVADIFTGYFLDIADGSDLVLCISQQSEKDFLALMDRTGGRKPKTHVFPLGDNVPLSNDVAGELISDQVTSLCKEAFLLFVSTIERRKNHEVLYRAYHLLASRGKAHLLPKLVFVGMQGWGVNDLMKDLELDPLTRGLIIRLNHVSDVELNALYRHALACLFPSLYEGWGLPVGEALAMGKVVLCSGQGSLPEVGGDLVRYIDPWHPEAWASEIWKLVTDIDGRIAAEMRVRETYKSRKWSDAAASIKHAMDELF